MSSTVLDHQIDFTPQFKRAFELMEHSQANVFLTGQAGTGKSTLLKYFRDHTRKNAAFLAPTGVAAVNIKGQTIHSFFRFRPDITVQQVYDIKLRKQEQKMFRSLDAIIIDEISMVRADLLDCIDGFLRIYGKEAGQPFGGVQLIFFGDLYQLPPVVNRQQKTIFEDLYKSPYFFDANAYESLNLKFIRLDKIYRQQDEEFIKLLGTIRNKTAAVEDLNILNSRLNPQFSDDEYYIYLTTTNAMADRINQEQLLRLEQKTVYCEADILGNFDNKMLPTHESLALKTGAQVMLLNNDSQGRWVNGSIGKVTYLNEEGFGTEMIEVELSNGEVVEVAPYTWEMFKYYYNDETESVESESVGSFTQYPIKLSWAITIHKSQGKTFDKVVLDIGTGTFSHGQTYVALSRCTSLEGLVLRKPIYQRHILLDRRIVDFMASVETNMLTSGE